MGKIGVWEITLILLVVILLFGAKKLPELGSAIGKALKEFKKAGKEIKDEINDTAEDKDSGTKV